MRVLYFSDSYGPHDVRFLAFLAESGCDVLYLQRRAGRVFDSRPLPPGVTSLPPLDADGRRPRRLGITLLDELRRALSQATPDIVHAGPIQSCAWLAAEAGCDRLVSMSWGSDLLAGSEHGLGRWQAVGALQRTSAFVGDCQAVRRKAIESGMPPARTFVFPWGVDLELFRPGRDSNVRRRLEWQDKTVVLSLRSWEHRYGVDTVVDAFLRAARRAPSLRLILGGDGSLRPELVGRIEASGLADRFWLPGYVAYDDLPMLYHAADVYVSGSHVDGSSVSLLEAMACGLPSYVSDIPGNREWIEDEATGAWFPPGEAAALAELLEQTPERMPELVARGHRARAVAEARADWKRNAPLLLRAYDLALDGGGGNQ